MFLSLLIRALGLSHKLIRALGLSHKLIRSLGLSHKLVRALGLPHKLVRALGLSHKLVRALGLSHKLVRALGLSHKLVRALGLSQARQSTRFITHTPHLQVRSVTKYILCITQNIKEIIIIINLITYIKQHFQPVIRIYHFTILKYKKCR